MMRAATDTATAAACRVGVVGRKDEEEVGGALALLIAIVAVAAMVMLRGRMEAEGEDDEVKDDDGDNDEESKDEDDEGNATEGGRGRDRGSGGGATKPAATAVWWAAASSWGNSGCMSRAHTCCLSTGPNPPSATMSSAVRPSLLLALRWAPRRSSSST
jgi:hypothetical protein